MNSYEEFDYLALDVDGLEYRRKARTVGELPAPVASAALKDLSSLMESIVGIPYLPGEKLYFGRPIHYSFGLKRSEVQAHLHCNLLSMLGSELPLSLIPSLPITLN